MCVHLYIWIKESGRVCFRRDRFMGARARVRGECASALRTKFCRTPGTPETRRHTSSNTFMLSQPSRFAVFAHAIVLTCGPWRGAFAFWSGYRAVLAVGRFSEDPGEEVSGYQTSCSVLSSGVLSVCYNIWTWFLIKRSFQDVYVWMEHSALDH